MSLIVQVTVVNDLTGEVEKTYVEATGAGLHPWEVVQTLRQFFKRVFAVAYPGSDEW